MAKKEDPPRDPVREAAAALGSRGGTARAKKLTAKERKAIARSGAEARWGKPKKSE